MVLQSPPSEIEPSTSNDQDKTPPFGRDTRVTVSCQRSGHCRTFNDQYEALVFLGKPRKVLKEFGQKREKVLGIVGSVIKAACSVAMISSIIPFVASWVLPSSPLIDPMSPYNLAPLISGFVLYPTGAWIQSAVLTKVYDNLITPIPNQIMTRRRLWRLRGKTMSPFL